MTEISATRMFMDRMALHGDMVDELVRDAMGSASRLASTFQPTKIRFKESASLDVPVRDIAATRQAAAEFEVTTQALREAVGAVRDAANGVEVPASARQASDAFKGAQGLEAIAVMLRRQVDNAIAVEGPASVLLRSRLDKPSPGKRVPLAVGVGNFGHVEAGVKYTPILPPQRGKLRFKPDVLERNLHEQVELISAKVATAHELAAADHASLGGSERLEMLRARIRATNELTTEEALSAPEAPRAIEA